MFEGTLISINIAAEAEAPMQSVNEVRAVPGKGLEGDRYFDHKGTFSKSQPDRELTLIEAEAVEAMKRVPWTTLAELKGDPDILKRIDDAEALLKSLRKTLSS